jgi:DNA-binding NarL/FixJ family response regulator
LIRVLLVDDHRLVRAGLQSLLEACEDIEVVGSAADGREALDLVGRVEPDVVLMDLSMPGMGGVEATRRLLDAHPGVQVVVLTSFSDQEQVLDAVDAGAVGYLLKDADPDALVDGVRAAAAGQSPLDPKVARTLLTRRGGQAPRTSSATANARSWSWSPTAWPTSRSPATWASPSARSRPT